MDIKQKIHETVTGSPVVLFMKGNKQFPQCGFSGIGIVLPLFPYYSRCAVRQHKH